MPSFRRAASFAAVTMLLVVVCALTGCSGGSSSGEAVDEEGARTIEVHERGAIVKLDASVAEDGTPQEIPTAHFAFVVSNPQDGYIAQNVGFDVVGYDEFGNVVFSGASIAGNVFPGIQTALSGSAAVDSSAGVETRVTKIDIEPIMPNVHWLPTKLSNEDIATIFEVVDENVNDGGDIFTLSATIAGDLDDVDAIPRIGNVEGVLEGHCIALLYDENGEVLMGSESSSVLVDQDDNDKAAEGRQDEDASLPINASTSISNPPAYKTYKLFVMPGL